MVAIKAAEFAFPRMEAPDLDEMERKVEGVPSSPRLELEARRERTYQHTCVAVSDDGISWTKPKLRLIKDPLTGTLDNNHIDRSGRARPVAARCPVLLHMRRAGEPVPLTRALHFVR